MPSNLAYLQTFLSGGAANTVEGKSLGGPISATRVLSQAATAPTTITGVTVEDAAGNNLGVGTLTFIAQTATVTPKLQWTPPGGSIGTAIDISVSGKYAIQGAGNGGLLFVDVVAGSIPSSNLTNSLTITSQVNKQFDDVSKAEALAGDTEYRCLYLKNTHGTDSMVDVRLWRAIDTAGQDVMTYELDPAGNGNGTSTGVASGTFQAAKTITAATWAASVATYTSTAHGYAVGDLVNITGITPTGYNVPANLITVVTANTFDIAVAANPGAYTSGGSAKRFEENTAPTGVTFSSNAISEVSSLVIGDLAPGVVRAYWKKRVVPANTTVATPADTERTGLRAYI